MVEALMTTDEVLGLCIAWCAQDPGRIGEVALLDPAEPLWILSSPVSAAQSQPGGAPVGRPLRFFRQRPPGAPDTERPDGMHDAADAELATLGRPPFRIELHADEGHLQVRSTGPCPLRVNGTVATAAVVSVGDTLYLEDYLLLVCVQRPRELPPLRYYPPPRVGRFGEPDQEGMVGESPALWKLRERLAACALSDFHVLVIGGSGSGKELAAQAIHRLSRRAGKPLVADNISVMPASLASVLLFGNKRNFPNPGMDERVGLIGAADGSTLFLDEIGDMPAEVQPMFLRITERGGEYFRLGEESRPRRSGFRLVGATNRPEQMRYELKRRFQREIRVPGLEQRREDIPLLIRQLLIVQARSDLIDAARFVSRGQPRVHPLLVDQLVRHKYTTHISEISFLLGQAMSESAHDVLLPLRTAPAGQPSAPHGSDDATVRPGPRLLLRKRPPRRTGPRPLPSPQRAQQELDACNGDVTRTAAQLGISRDQLNRMIRREGLRVVRVRSGSGLQPRGTSRSDTEAREESDEASDEASERPQRSAERRAQ